MLKKTKKSTGKVRDFEIVSTLKYLDIKKILPELNNEARIMKYAYIIHDKDVKEDGTPVEPHYHIAIRCHNQNSLTTVANWFGVEKQYVQKVRGKYGDALLYLTHMNAPEKYQYADEEVTSNYAWTEERDKRLLKKEQEAEIREEKLRIHEIIQKIATGELKEWNYQDDIDVDTLIDYKKEIDIAFKYRADSLKNENRTKECIFIYGDSESGKTTFAKKMCEEKNLSYVVTGSDNDPLEAYRGQDVIIFDDLRPGRYSSSDLLKMLDNHTSSMVRSRYRNKSLECKLIIITSVYPIEDFLGYTKGKPEPIEQLKRRCSLYIKFQNDRLCARVYDPILKDYGPATWYENPIHNLYPKVSLSREDIDKKLDSFITAKRVYK